MEYIQKLKTIVKNLEKCERVTKHTTLTENQADTLGNAFLDIENSLSKIINEQIPTLYLEDLEASKIDDLILDIGEELRHLLYHVNDTRVYDYLKDEKK